MTNKEKTAAFVLVGSFAFFYFVIRPRIRLRGQQTANQAKQTKEQTDSAAEDREMIKEPTIEPAALQNPTVSKAYNAMKAYISAFNNGETMEDIRTMVRDIKAKLGLKVYQKSDGRVAVSDNLGKDIIINN